MTTVLNLLFYRMIRSINFHTICNDFKQHEIQHPLVEVIHFSTAGLSSEFKKHFGWYGVVLSSLNNLGGRLVFIAPGQDIKGKNNMTGYHPDCTLLFHPDLIRGTPFAKGINEYSFFDNQTNGSLHLSPQEYQLALDCLANIEMELGHPRDKFSKRLITTNIELFFNYSERFYSRQYIPRKDTHKGILKPFEELLNRYFEDENLAETGHPSVAYFADELHLSPNYFGDLIKKETGKSAQEYIQHKIVEEAKNRIFDNHKSIYEIAYELGFKYPQHFSRFFKNVVGQSPKEYRNTIVNEDLQIIK